jgi:hypothetical protein
MPISDIMSTKLLHIVLLANAFGTSSSPVASSLVALRMGDRPELKPRDSRKVGWIARVERQRTRNRACRDERVIRARRRLAPRHPQCRRYGSKCTRAITIKRKNVKIGLGLLQVLLTGTALGIVTSYKRAYGKLGQRYRANHRFVGKLVWVGNLAEENHR